MDAVLWLHWMLTETWQMQVVAGLCVAAMVAAVFWLAPSDGQLYAMSTLAALVGVFLVFQSTGRWLEAQTFDRWREVPATLVDSRSECNRDHIRRTHCHHWIDYSYVVAGKTYRGDRFNFAGTLEKGVAETRKRGRDLTVWHHPTWAYRAVIEPRAAFWSGIFSLVGGIVLIAGALTLLRRLRLMSRQQREPD